MLRCHLILRQRAGFVRANDGSAPQGFDGRKFANDRATACHSRNTNRECHRERGRQTFGDHRDRQRDRGGQCVNQRCTTRDFDDENQRGECKNRIQNNLAELGNLARQWRVKFRCRSNELRDAPDFGVVTNRDDDACCLSVCDECGRVRHIASLGKQRVRCKLYVRIFLHRDRFASECRFGNLQIARTQQTQIGRHFVARFQRHNIAGHKFGRVNALRLATANHGRFGRHRLRQCFDCFFGFGFLQIADDRVNKHRAENHQRVNRLLLDDEGDDAGRHQEVEQGIVELQEETHQRTLAAFWRENIFAKTFLAMFDLKLVQPFFDMAVQPFDNFSGRQVVPMFAE